MSKTSPKPHPRYFSRLLIYHIELRNLNTTIFAMKRKNMLSYRQKKYYEMKNGIYRCKLHVIICEIKIEFRLLLFDTYFT